MSSNDGMTGKSAAHIIQRILMVPPKHFTVEYNINPWMGGVVDKAKAMQQWTVLKNAIEKQGVKVLTLEQTEGLPDQVFVCNSGLTYNNKVYLSKFRHKERTGEQPHYLKWYKENGIETIGEGYEEVFEGGGDAVFSDLNTLWAGYGERSSKSVYEKVKALGKFDIVLCDMVDPNFYHLDTCFAPVDEKTAIYYPPAFSKRTQEEKSVPTDTSKGTRTEDVVGKPTEDDIRVVNSETIDMETFRNCRFRISTDELKQLGSMRSSVMRVQITRKYETELFQQLLCDVSFVNSHFLNGKVEAVGEQRKGPIKLLEKVDEDAYYLKFGILDSHREPVYEKVTLAECDEREINVTDVVAKAVEKCSMGGQESRTNWANFVTCLLREIYAQSTGSITKGVFLEEKTDIPTPLYIKILGMTGKSAAHIIQRILMVPPKHFTVEYNINPWMGGVVDKAKAMQQWTVLKNAIEKQGVKVLTLEQTEGLPDQVFVCNSGLTYNNKVYLSKFRHKERTGEQPHYLKWYKENGIETIGEGYEEVFEGGGDAVFSDLNTLWAGYGERSSKSAYERVKALGKFDIVLCDIVDPIFYHLGTCFTPVDEHTAIYYPPAFSKNTQEEIVKRLPKSVAISKEEANAFVCNAITIRDTVISPIGVAEKTRKALKELGKTVEEVDMSEFMKSGGACQCLVLRLL